MEELKLDRSTKFLVISIENISKSRLNQLEEWKQLDNPNKSSVDRLNRKIITEVNLNNDDEDNDESGRPSRANTQDTYKLYLEDVSTKKLLKLMKMNHCGFTYREYRHSSTDKTWR